MRTIYIKTTSGMGRTYTFDVEWSTTIKQLKEQFLKKTNNKNNGQQIRLVWNEYILDEDNDYTLSQCNIEDGSVLTTVDLDKNTRQLGLHLPLFVDVSNSKGLKRIEWAKTAPDWRIAPPGLCLEGLCTNKDCKAHKQYVIMSMGFIRFNIIVDADADSTKCPICQQYVNPTKCAFSNCWWRYQGKKQEDGKQPQKCSCDWQHADNAYHYFDEDTSGMITWRELIVETVKNKPL